MYFLSFFLIVGGFLGCRYSTAQQHPDDLSLDSSDVFPIAFVMGCMLLLCKLVLAGLR